MEEFGDHQVVLLVDVDRFEWIDLEHDRSVAHPASPGDLLGGGDVEIRVLLVDRRKILRPEQDRRVVVHRNAVGDESASRPATSVCSESESRHLAFSNGQSLAGRHLRLQTGTGKA